MSTSFTKRHAERYDRVNTVDHCATKQTKALYENLKTQADSGILFGHQDALSYGVKWKEWHKKKSDVQEVCGKYPAVFGWDVSKLGTSTHNIDSVNFRQMKRWIKEVYKMGGVNTVSWHLDNFVDGGNAWEVGGRVIERILPNGSHHQQYKEKLDLFAEFIEDLTVGFIFKTDIPIIFRPFHEHTGHWFWWGSPHHSTPEEYKALWQFTVEYLRDKKGLHNLLYAYSPDVFEDEAHYLQCYPGDDYVDILGLDDYHDFGSHGSIDDLLKRLRIIVNLANKKGKVAALTETGLDKIPQDDWWTNTLLYHIKNDSVANKIAWILVWRNARLEHHYAPYPNHPSAPNFVKFSNDSTMIFQNRLPNLYHLD